MIDPRVAYASLALRYRRLAQGASAGAQRVGVKRRAAVPRPSIDPPSPRDFEHEGRMRARKQLTEVFRLAQERGAVDFAVGRLADGWKPSEIAATLRALPEAQARRYGLAARIAAYQATLTDDGSASSTTPSGTAAAMIATYRKAIGDDVQR